MAQTQDTPDNNKMSLHYEIDGDDFTVAGEASSDLKNILKRLGVNSNIIRKVSISMYEAEINTVIHGKGGYVDVDITTSEIRMVFTDSGPGIADIELAMTEGFSTATDSIRELGFGAGMGLPNIKKYSDSIKITSEPNVKTTVEIIVRIN